MTSRVGWILLLVALPLSAADAATVRVAVNGVDGQQCGVGKNAPCRTITRAIENATVGDTIEVGPGRYGDVDGDGQFNSPGDELAQVDVGCDCVVQVPVDKRLVIVSRLGATATLIDAGGAPVTVVDVEAAGTVFGKAKKGFTLSGSSSAPGLESSAPDLTVAGNVAFGNASHGMRISGDRLSLVGNHAVANGSSGFQLDGAADAVIRGNSAVGNGDDGFNQVNRGSAVSGNVASGNADDGFDQQGDDVAYSSNSALGNGGIGFDLNGGERTVLAGVLAQGNQNGIAIDAPDVVITKSAFVANRGAGILVEDEGQRLTVGKSNVFGNGTVGEPVLLNCGVASASGGPLTLATVFWGAASGPDADPADEICLLVPHGTLVVEPVATKEVKVKPPR